MYCVLFNLRGQVGSKYRSHTNILLHLYNPANLAHTVKLFACVRMVGKDFHRFKIPTTPPHNKKVVSVK